MIVLPWKMLHGDNHRMMPIVIPRKGQKPLARLIQTPEYREGKESLEGFLVVHYRGERHSAPVQLYARCFFPDRRKRDAGNYRKFIGDAMTGICYTDDSLVHKETWEFCGIDRENPRVEITITAIHQKEAA